MSYNMRFGQDATADLISQGADVFSKLTEGDVSGALQQAGNIALNQLNQGQKQVFAIIQDLLSGELVPVSEVVTGPDVPSQQIRRELGHARIKRSLKVSKRANQFSLQLNLKNSGLLNLVQAFSDELKQPFDPKQDKIISTQMLPSWIIQPAVAAQLLKEENGQVVHRQITLYEAPRLWNHPLFLPAVGVGGVALIFLYMKMR